jgi:hypothetical protein
MGTALEFLKLMLPVVTAFVAGYLVNRLKTREDFIEKRCEELCNSAFDAAELGQDYWLKDQKDIDNELIGTKITAKLQKLALMRVKLEKFLSLESSSAIIDQEQRLQRSITGGDFGVHNRNADVSRAKEIIFSVHSYDTTVRMARLDDLKGLWRR